MVVAACCLHVLVESITGSCAVSPCNIARDFARVRAQSHCSASAPSGRRLPTCWSCQPIEAYVKFFPSPGMVTASNAELEVVLYPMVNVCRLLSLQVPPHGSPFSSLTCNKTKLIISFLLLLLIIDSFDAKCFSTEWKHHLVLKHDFSNGTFT